MSARRSADGPFARLSVKRRDLVAGAATAAAVAGAGWVWLPAGLGLAAAVAVLAALAAGRDVRRALAYHDRRVAARTWLAETLRPRAPLPGLSGWAVGPDLGQAIVAHVLAARPARVLELGAGASTILLGYALERAGSGRLLSLEHDAAHAAAVAGDVRLHGLEDVVEVRHAPLAAVDVEGEPHRWYDVGTLEGAFDLLLIDGPPARLASRYPAVPLLAPRLAPDGVVFVDDTRRPAGRSDLARWERRPGVVVEAIETEEGAAILRGVGRAGGERPAA